MKRLAMLAGLITLAFTTPSFAAEQTCDTWINGRFVECPKPGAPQATPQGPPPECTGYGAANTKPAHCKQWENWPGQPGTGQPGTGTAQPWPPEQGTPGQNQTTTQRCPPGTYLVRYGSKWRCIRRGGTPGQDQAGGQCQPGWIYSRRLYRCVPGTIPGTGTVGQGPGQGPYDQGTPGRRICGYGKVWSERLYRCVPFRTGGGTDGGNQGGYGCGPGERWSESRYRCVSRRGGSGGIYIDLGGIGGNIGISNKRRCGHGTYWDGYRCVARRDGGTGDDYGYRSGGGDYGGGGRRRGGY